MKRLAVAILISAPLLDTGPTASATVRSACKPVPPIEIEARLTGDPGGALRIVASASSRLDAEIEIDVTLPDGVTVAAGEPKRKGKRPEVKLDLRVRDRSSREILVRATMETGGARLTRVVPLALGPTPKAPLGVLKKNSRGEAIRELAP